MSYSTVIYEQGDDHVVTLTINRPEAMNSFNAQMVREFGEIWRRISDDDSVHAVVVRASPGRAFCPGVDVKEATSASGSGKPDPVMMSDNIWQQADPGERLSPKQQKCWKPVICAVHGMAAGGAFYWINESDIVICSEDATFFDPHVTYGMTAALEPIGMTRRILLGDVLRIALLGNDERISAQTALRIGLVSEVVPLDRLWPRAHELAAQIAAKPPAGIQGTVRAIWESLDVGRNAALSMALKYCQLGNPVGTAQVDRWAIMGKAKKYDVR
ncbi:MAG: enoyl-CoA hydratase/isomerase family protein [Gammaproteobacteria bacterium]